MSGLSLVAQNVHDVSVEGRRMLFHVPTTSLFEMDGVSAAVLDLFRDHEEVTPHTVRGAFDGRFAPEDLSEVIDGFVKLDILRDSRKRDQGPQPIQVESFPLSTIVLNVNTGCNLSCT
ncbi:MAG: quinohemoprotein amine dehydrogenase maturase, partial [Kiloniellales bacterium]|nr:quinohemoprotein amine dehydrogenase maturase [Kiloniellales bacterium]